MQANTLTITLYTDGNAQTLTFSTTSTFNFGLLSFTGSGFTKTVATAAEVSGKNSIWGIWLFGSP